MLEIKNLRYNYEDWNLQVDNISFNKGEITSLIGKSGLGKSTLLNLIAGFNQTTTGKILLDNVDISKKKPHKRDVNILFQDNNLFHQLNIWENIALGVCNNLKPNPKQKALIQEVIENVKLTGKEKSYPKELSGGQQQRVAIARILLRNKKILLLDEPFNGLDNHLRQEILTLTHTITQEKNLITILVSHHKKDLTLSTKTHTITQSPNHKTSIIL